MAYVDLGELDPGGALDGVLSQRRGSLVRFKRSDYLGDPDRPLADCVRDLVEQQTGSRLTGPIRMLTQLRTAGWNFNPISVYYCFETRTDAEPQLDDRAPEELAAVVFDVTNTPWGEHHAYVVEADGTRVADATLAKALHVSPFMPMDLEYRFSCTTPGESCSVRFELWRGHRRVFDADLGCRRIAALDRRGLRRLQVRHPLMPLMVSIEIYYEAVRLAWKRAPFHRHPDHARRRSVRVGAQPVAEHETRRTVA